MIFTLTGPSGSGKSALMKELLKNVPENAFHMISTTTRKKRRGERNGIDYHFVNEKEFHERKLVESDNFGDTFYGLTVDEVTAARHRPPDSINVAILDPKGVANLKKYCKPMKVYTVYINVDPETAFSRLCKRDGKAAAKARQVVDKQNGLLDPTGYDCVITNDGTVTELFENFMNYVVALQFANKLEHYSQ